MLCLGGFGRLMSPPLMHVYLHIQPFSFHNHVHNYMGSNNIYIRNVTMWNNETFNMYIYKHFIKNLQ